MEDWQRTHITKNLDKLVEMTECSVLVLARLKSRSVLSVEDVNRLETIGQAKGKMHQNFKLYEILETRKEGYGILMETLKRSKQSGALKILQKGDKINAKFYSPPNVLKDFLREQNKPLLIWAVMDVKVNRLWIQQTMHDNDDDFDVECVTLEDLPEILEDPPESKLVCLVKANLKEVTELLKSGTNPDKVEFTSVFPNWTNLTIKFQNQLKQRPVHFLGKEIKFEDILEKLVKFKFPLKNLTGNFLIHLIKDKRPSLVQNKKYPAQQPYIERKLRSKRMISVNSIQKISDATTDIFVLSGFYDKYEATRILKRDYDISSTFFGKTKIASKLILLQSKGDYEMICRKANVEQPVHLLHYLKDKQAFQWAYSRGKLNSIRSSMQSKEVDVSEKTLVETEIKHFAANIVITGDPGMGKTSVLMNLIKDNTQIQENATFVKLLSFREFISSIQKKLKDQARPTKLQILNSLTNSNELEDEIVRLFLRTKELNCLLTLDGYDELQENQEEVTKLVLRTLSHMKNIKVIITSRRHKAAELENLFNTVAYELQPFSPDDQLNFLLNFWGSKGVMDIDKLKPYGQTCLQNFKPSQSNSEKNIFEVPLYCQLLAEVLETDAIRFADPNTVLMKDCILPTNIISNVTEMYSKLFAKKRKEFEIRFGKASLNKVDFFHVETALLAVTPSSDYWVHHLDCGQDSYCETETELAQVLFFGVIKEADAGKSITFTHQTIAEYIIAEYAFKALQNEVPIRDWDAFLEYLIFYILHPIANKVRISIDFEFEDDNAIKGFQLRATGVSFFLNELLESAMPHLSALDYPSLQEPSYGFWNSVFGSRLVACIIGDHLNLVKILMSSGPTSKLELKREEATKLLIITARFGSKGLMKEIQNFIKQNIEDLQMEQMSHILEFPNGTKCHFTPLHAAIERGSYELFNFLISTCGFDHFVHKLKYLLHSCVYGSAWDSQHVIQDRKQIITLLVKANKYVLDEHHDYFQVTPILRNYIHMELLKHLASFPADVNGNCSNAPESLGEGENVTVLHKPYLYLIELEPRNYHDLLLQFNKAGYNCWNLIATKNGTSFGILENIVRYLDATDQTLDFLVEQNIDFSLTDAFGNSMVLLAVHSGRSKRFIRKLIHLGGDMQKFGSDGDTTLNAAVRRGDESIIRMLIREFGADINLASDNKHGILPIHWSASISDVTETIKMIKFLQELGADINMRDKNSNTILHMAISRPSLNTESKPMTAEELHEFLIFLKSVNFRHFALKNYNGCTPLHYAVLVSEPSVATVEFLIALGNDVNSVDKKCQSVLKYAIDGGRPVNFLKALVQKNADIYWRGMDGTTVLHYAVLHGHVEALDYFAKSISIHLVDEEMRPPLHYIHHLKTFEKLAATLNALVRLGANINCTDSKGNTLLNYPFKIGPNDFHRLILLLHKLGFNLRIKTKTKLNVLTCAVIQLEFLERTLSYLQKQSVKINGKDEHGRTPIMYAIKMGRSIDFIKLLLRNGADLKAKTKSGENCLQVAVQHGNLVAAEMLVKEYRLDINSLGNVYLPIHKTAFAASFNSMMEAIKLLVSLGADVNAIVDNQTFLHFVLRIHSFPPGTYSSFEFTSIMFNQLIEYLDSNGFKIAQQYDGYGFNILQVTVLTFEPLEPTLKLLKSRHEDFNAVDTDGSSVLFYAIENNYSIECIELLIKYGVKRDTCKFSGDTVLHCAALNGHIQAVRLFVEKYGMDINSKYLTVGYRPLHCVVMTSAGSNLVDNILALTQLGADVNATDEEGNTVLHYFRKTHDEKLQNLYSLVHRKHHKKSDAELEKTCEVFGKKFIKKVDKLTGEEFQNLIECLDSLQFDFKARNSENLTVLHLVMRNNRENLLETSYEFLLSKGLSLDDKDVNGDSVLVHAIRCGRNRKFIEGLLKHGPNLDVRNRYKENLLHCAATEGNIEAVELFCEIKKELINEIDVDGYTPFHLAAAKKSTQLSLQVGKLLAENGTKLDAVAYNGLTPHLHFTIENEYSIAKFKEFEKLVPMTEKIAYANFKCLLKNVQSDDHGFRSLAKYLKTKCTNLLKSQVKESPILHEIVKCHSFPGVKYLVEEVKVDVDAVDEFGKTALQSMTCFCKRKPEEFMITNGCGFESEKCVNIVAYLIKFDRVVKTELRKL